VLERSGHGLPGTFRAGKSFDRPGRVTARCHGREGVREGSLAQWVLPLPGSTRCTAIIEQMFVYVNRRRMPGSFRTRHAAFGDCVGARGTRCTGARDANARHTRENVRGSRRHTRCERKFASQYERALRQVTSPDNREIAGLLHAAGGFAEDGVCATEVWESLEAFQTLFAEHLDRAMQDAGVDYVPRACQVANTDLAI
jgi:hypothetical protein